MSDVRVGPDGLARCPWAVSTPDYLAYHDCEWGRVVHGERALYERMTLEAFQSGLAWITILRKRPGFRAAFAEFDPEAVARFTDEDRARLMADAGIVRNRLKIDAAISNAQGCLTLRDAGTDLDELIWGFAPESAPRPSRLSDVNAVTPASTSLAKELKRRGFRFVGPTTAHALMQACGLVDEHLVDCSARPQPVR